MVFTSSIWGSVLRGLPCRAEPPDALLCEAGSVYEGYWDMGLKNGWGRETVERTGQVFEGRFRSGYKHGFGVMHYGNGDAYHGQVTESN